ncbi:MAG: hypothetical protein RL009_1190, partial [Actinomycetota bacterium]
VFIVAILIVVAVQVGSTIKERRLKAIK